MNYQNGKIYQILNNIDDDVYVGSTCQTLSQRMTYHRSDAKRGVVSKVYQKMREVGIEHFYIELIEVSPCNSIEELLKREGHFIRELGTLNNKVAGRSKKEYYIETIDKRQQYLEIHKVQIAEKKKEYREVHNEHISEYNKEYHEANKVHIQERRKATYMCECGSTYRRVNKTRHELTKKHQQFITTNELLI